MPDRATSISLSENSRDQIAMRLKWSGAILILAAEFRGISQCSNRLGRQAIRLSRVRACLRVRVKFVGKCPPHGIPNHGFTLLRLLHPTIGHARSTTLAWHPVYQWRQNIISRMV